MIRPRCAWVPADDPLYRRYHDEEWGVPVFDERLMSEFLILETFQAGLSWRTILNKRENFRRSFSNFDFVKVAAFDETDIARLMQDKGIIRNGLKIKAAIKNARAVVRLHEAGRSLVSFFWEFTGGQPIINSFHENSEIPPLTPLAETISIELKKLGFAFVGPTVVYAHMQATGLVNDHLCSCFRYAQVTVPAAAGNIPGGN